MSFRRYFPLVALLVGLLSPIHAAQSASSDQYVPILLYHHIDYKFGTWHVSPAKLNSELLYLEANGYHTITMATYLNARQGRGTLPDKPVVLTFDDGDRDAYENALPLLRQFHQVATFYIISGVVGKPDYVSWPQLRQMQADGMEIGAHTVDHPFLTRLTPLHAFLEIWLSKLSLEFHLMTPITTFAYPDNAHNAAIASLVKLAGFRSAVIVSPQTGDDLMSPLEIPRITILPAEGYHTFAYEVSAGKLRATLAEIGG